MEIKIVSFDMEGTLIDHSFSQHIWEVEIPSLYAKNHHITFDEAYNEVISEYQKIGEGRPEWYDIQYWWNHLELPEKWDNILLNNKHRCNLYPEVPDALSLLGKYVKLIVSSNTIREFLNIQLRVIDYPFVKSFSGPSDFGCIKNTSEFYEKVCLQLNVKPNEVAHVGDHYLFDYLVAKSAGIHAFYLDRTATKSGPDTIYSLTDMGKKLFND